MAKYSNTIAYQIQTKLDATGLNQLQQQLSSVTKSFAELNKTNELYGQKQMNEDIANVQKVQTALSKSFNTSLNLIDLSTFQKQLGSLSLGELQTSMSKTAEGTKAFNSMLGTIGQIDTGFKNISSLSDKIMNTFGNTVRWGVTASIFQTIQNSLYSSVDYIKELDTSLNNIQIVTGETSSNLTEWAKSANEAAAQLGASTTAFTDAAQLYAQNGYSQEDYTKLAELTTKVANVTQQSTSEVSEEITSLMAGYKMSIDEAEDALSGMATVAAASASDLGELATAEQKVASAASTLGVSQDELTAQLSTIISVTREAPEQVGNSLKTIYARLGDLSLGETLEDGVSLGDVSSTLEKVGVTVLDVNGDMRSMGDILEDLMAKWGDLSQAEQQALAVKLAGKYQYNNLMTLMNNSDMYYEQKNMAGSSQGALDEQQAIYMESMEAKLQTLQTKWEGVIQSVVNADAFKPFIDAASTGLDIVSDIADTIGGMGPALTLVASLMTKAFSQNVAAGISNMITNKQRSNMLSQNEDTIISMLGGTDIQGTASSFLKGTVGTRDTLTSEQAVGYNEELSRYVEVDNKVKEANDRLDESYLNIMETLDKYDIKINKITGDITTNTDDIRTQAEAVDRLLEKIGRYNELKGLESTQNGLNDEQRAEYKKLTNKNSRYDLSSNNDTIKELVNSGDTEIREAYDALKKAEEKDGDNSAEYNKALQALEKSLKKTSNGFKELDKKITEHTQLARESATAINMQTEANTNALRSAQKINFQQAVQQIVNMTSALGQMAFAFQTIKGLADTWSDPDTSTMDKLLQTMSAMVIVVPQLVSGWTQWSQSFETIKNIIPTILAQQQRIIDAEAGETTQEVLNAAAKQENINKTNEKVVAEKAAAVATGEAAEEDVVEAQTSLTNAAANLTQAKAQSHLAGVLDGTIENVEESEKAIVQLGTSVNKSLTTLKSFGSGAGDAGKKLLTAGTDAEISGKKLSIFSLGVSTIKEAVTGLLATLSAALPVLIAFAGVAALVYTDTQKVKDAEEKASTTSDALTKNQTKVDTDTSSFDEAYETYKKTGVVTDELKSSAKTLADTLEITSGDALISAGNFDALATAIKSAKKEAEDANPVLADASYTASSSAYNAEGNSLTSDNTGFNSLSNEAKKKLADGVAGSTRQTTTTTTQDVVNDSTGEVVGTVEVTTGASDKAAFFSASAAQQLGEINDALEEASARYEELNKKKATSEGLSEDEEKEYDRLASDISNYQTMLKDENLQNSQTALKAKATAEFDGVKESSSDYTGLSLEDQQTKLLSENSGIADYAKSLGATEGQKYIYGLLGSFGSENQQKIANGINSLFTGLTDDGQTEEDAKKKADEFSEAISNNLSNADAADLFSSLDADTIKNNIDQIISMINSGEGVDAIKLKFSATKEDIEDAAKTAEESTEAAAEATEEATKKTQEEVSSSSVLKRSGISEDDYSDYKNTAKSTNKDIAKYTNQASEAQEELNEKITQTKKAMAENSQDSEEAVKAYKVLQKRLKKLEKEYDEYGDALDNSAALQLECETGAEELQDSFSDWSKTLTKSSKGSKEYVEALNDMSSSVGKFLNVDMSDWSSDLKDTFITENLSKIQSALAGDTQALAELQAKAKATDILVGMNVDPNANTELYNSTYNLVSYAQSILPNIEVGATIDDSQYVEKLDEMVADMQEHGATMEQIISALSEAGIEMEVTYKDVYIVDDNGDGTFSTHSVSTVDHITYKKKADGSSYQSKYDGPSNTGTGTGTGTTPSSGSSGDSGGSGDDDYSDDQTELTENEIDRYEKVNAHLDDIASSLDTIADEQDRLTGQKYIENISQQISLLKEEVEWEEKKLEIEKQEAAEYKNILANDYGVTFNSDGFIENYADIYNQLLAVVNDYERQYNATTSKSAKDSIQDQIDSAQDRLDNFSDYIEKYDELLTSTIKESKQKIQQYYNDIEDLQIEAFNKRLEATSNVKDLLESRADFNTNFERLLAGDYGDEDPYYDTLNALEKVEAYWDADSEAMQEYYDTLIAKQQEIVNSSDATDAEKKWAQSRIDNYAAYKEGHVGDAASSTGDGLLSMVMKDLADVQEQYRQFQETGTSEIFGENSAELLESLQTARDNAKDVVEALKDDMADVLDGIIDQIDTLGDEIDDRMDDFDNITDQLDSYLDIIEAVNGDEAYEQMNTVLAAQIQNGNTQIENIKQTIQVLKSLQSTMQEGSDEWKEVQEKIEDAQDELLEKTSDTLDKIATQFENKITSALNGWVGNIFGNSDLDWLGEEWEMIERNADQYLDDVNSAYNIQKLQSKYLDLLDNSNQLSVQNQITEQMNQQLDYLREKDKLSQYDVDYANAQFEILQKTIALQEAQANKSQMKLKRDNQGNYSYVYTANESDVSSAQSDLLDAENNAYNLSKDNIIENQQNFYSAIQSAYDTLLDTMTNTNLSMEEKAKRQEEIIDSLTEYVNGCSEQLSTSQKNILTDIIGMAEQLTSENKNVMQDVMDAMDEGNEAVFNALDKRLGAYATTTNEAMQKFTDAYESTFGSEGTVNQALKEYSDNLDEVSKSADLPLTNMANAVGEVKSQMDSLNSSTETYISTLADMSGKIETSEAKLQEMRSEISNAENEMRAFQGQYNDVSEKLVVSEREKADLQDQYKQLQEEYDAYRAAQEAAASSGSGSGDDGWSPYDDAYRIWMYGDYGHGGYWYGNYAAQNGSARADQVLALFNSGYGYTWMDTGGYTGDWGPGEGMSDAKNGKVAVLHSKELVLNATDTENILQAVSAVRQLTTNFRNGAFEDTVEAFNKYGSDLLQSTISAANTVDQEVHIEATFPNVKGAEEIEQALLSLTNGAIQYAGRSGQ